VETAENNQEVTKEDISETQTEEVQQPTDSEIESSDDYHYEEKLDSNANTTGFPTSSPKASELLPIESTSSIWSEDDIGILCLPSNIKTSEG